MTGTLTGRRPKTAREMGIMQGFPPPPEKRPSLENWDLAPFNRWSFQNTRQLFPTVAVQHDPAAVRELPRAEQDLGGVRFDGPEGALSVADWLTQSYTDGFILLHRGQVVMEHYDNDMLPATPHLAQSVSKSVIGALAGQLIAEGALDPDAPMQALVPDLAGTAYAQARLRDVLDMRSGVRFTEDYGLTGSDMTAIDIASGWRPVPAGTRRPTIRQVMRDLPQVRPHGSDFSYRSIETDAVAWVIECATGAEVARGITDRIWQPMGAEQDGFFTVDDEGTALADGGFNACLRDFARFGELIRTGGICGDRQVLPAKWVDGLFTACEPDAFGAPYCDLSPQGAYRDFWWVHDPQARICMARGVFGQLIYVDQRHDLVAVKLSTWPDYLIPARSQESVAALAALTRAVSG